MLGQLLAVRSQRDDWIDPIPFGRQDLFGAFAKRLRLAGHDLPRDIDLRVESSVAHRKLNPDGVSPIAI